ncbi:ketoacyl-ACP synthase III [Alicyclobacillus acidiphilus]|uniref:ketoacyl-ACP synthase III n=1 Tax=Alicyclobacillus acidiphilus TaxID=182455 RepID=UPI00082AF62A|nr:ketoacyl-ACP synthase III [Alicyclobacillus acidiphilus]
MTGQWTSRSRAKITALGTYVPQKVLSNDDLEKLVDTSNEWIVQRTGVRERRIAADDEFTSDLCIKAIEDMLRRYPISLHDVDLILVASITPDHTFPSVASIIQDHFDIPATAALDISAACAGFVSALQLADGMITSGMHKKVLVLGGETLSKVTDYSDRSTCILFGDGAGAVLVEHANDGAFIRSSSVTCGKAGIHLYRSGLSPRIANQPIAANGYIVQNGKEVFKLAVNTLVREIPALLNASGHALADVDWFVPHSANLRIVEAVCEKLHFPFERTLFSAEYYGNTSSASIPLAIRMGLDRGAIRQGDTLLLAGFGGGFVYASTLLRWTV